MKDDGIHTWYLKPNVYHLVGKHSEEIKWSPQGLDNVVWVKDKVKLPLNSSEMIDWNLTGELICLYNLKKEGALFW